MTTENPEQLPPPPFDESDKPLVPPSDTSLEAPVVGEVGEAVASSAETTLPVPTGTDEKAGNESTEGDEEELTFDQLVHLDRKNLKLLLGKVSPTTLAISLSRIDTGARDQVLGALSKAVATSVRTEIGTLGAVDDDTVEKAQDEIVELAEELEEKGAISLDALYEEDAESNTQPVASLSQKVERAKTPREKKAEAFTDYFKSVKTEAKFLEGIFEMPRDPKLREVVSVRELEKLSGELFSKIFGFFLEFEAKKKEKSSKEIIEFVEKSIELDQIPAGFQGAFRAVVYAEMTQKAPPVSSRTTAQERAEALLADYAQMKTGKQAGVSEGVPSQTKRSFDWLLKPKDPRQSADPVPEQPKTTKTAETPSAFPSEPEKVEPASVPPVESKPVVSSDTVGREREETKLAPLEAPVSVAQVEVATDTADAPAETKESVAPESIPGPQGWTRERIEALTFESIFDLNDDDFKSVLRGAAHSYLLGALLQGMSESLVERARDNVPIKPDFDEGFSQGVSDLEALGVWKGELVKHAKSILFEKYLVVKNQPPSTERPERKEPEITLPSSSPTLPASTEQAPAKLPENTLPERPQNTPASSGWLSRIVRFFRGNAPEQADVDSPTPSQTEKVWTREEVQALTFEEIFKLDTSDFKTVVGVGNGLTWGVALANENDAGVREKVAEAMTEIDRRNFLEGLKEVHGQKEIESAKARCRTYARRQLIAKHLSY